jgi:hypothetical protein
MATATQLNVLLIDGTTTVVVPITAALQTLDTAQSGYFGPDQAIRNIMRGGGFWDASYTTFRPASQIKSITYQ